MITLGDIAIMGGGCYGTFYLGQLEAARAKGALDRRRVLIVDRDLACRAAREGAPASFELVTADWGQFLDDWLDPSGRDRDGRPDMIVPTPFMPHLMAEWLTRRAAKRFPDRIVERVSAEAPVGTPYDRLHEDGVRYVSFADWLCPMHCVEPLLCPAIKAPRTWEMGDSIATYAVRRSPAQPAVPPALFTCRHVVHGVGMYPVRAAFAGFDAFVPFAGSPGGAELVIGSVSACHGAIAVLRVGPEPGTG